MKEYIEKFKNLDKSTLIEELKKLTLTSFQKNFIYVYLFPEPLKHMELLDIIDGKRKKYPDNDLLRPDENEVLILLRAYRTLQYNRFMLHLLHSYIGNMEGTYIVNEPVEKNTCAICGKPLYYFDQWDSISNSMEKERKEHLMYGNDQTGLCMCLDCMVQLRTLNSYLELVEGSDYLNKWKRS